jgi:hypothetical protein
MECLTDGFPLEEIGAMISTYFLRIGTGTIIINPLITRVDKYSSSMESVIFYHKEESSSIIFLQYRHKMFVVDETIV